MKEYKFKLKLTKKDILEKLTDIDIFVFYLGNKFKLNTKMRSPLRRDINPSFAIFKSSTSGSLLYKDHATGESGDCFKFVMSLFDVDYNKALEIINDDIILNKLTKNEQFNAIIEEEIRKKKETVIEIKPKKFNNFDIEYWDSFSISLETLKKFKVNACSEVYIDGKIRIVYCDIKNPIYSYKINTKYKIYRPFNDPKYKFVSNCSTKDIQGLDQIKYIIGDLLIITKSLKDCMVLHELGYYSISPNSETVPIPEDIMEDLKKRFKRIIIFYDNDQTGIKGARKLANKYDLKYILIPDKYYKDISDFVKDNDILLAKKLIDRLLK